MQLYAKRLARENERAVLDNLCKYIYRKLQKITDSIPHGYVNTILEENISDFNWLTGDIVNIAYKCYN